ncbi:hypothetical protein [Pararobbsia alpina]|uniref:Uncharacterized protein n=1 Tax=Pararobbsia alpina TaxID=621374 RepID=A0A6S7B892_9BURK|nr:hypothetical protein [Pararobbsia alpina]CAB3780711.1 hypothetical protein LMG28138_01102 [Pararobbsia alpina]
MATLAGFPYFEFEVDRQGTPVDQAARKQALEFAVAGETSDIVLMSHGRNNDMEDARELYRNFFTAFRKQLTDDGSASLARKFIILAVLWPSKKFTDEELIPGGAASAGSPITGALLHKKVADLKGVFDHPDADKILAKVNKLIPQLQNSQAARQQFADLVRELPLDKTGNAEDASDRLFKLTGAELMDLLAKPVMPPPIKRAGGGAADLGVSPGGAAGLGKVFSGVESAARNLLNFTTYYQMKERAGLVGKTAVHDLVREILTKAPKVKVHLVGHSFGARLVTSAALGPDGQPPLKFSSMTLLQAAFSHNGFAQKFDGKKDGFFRRVVSEGRISGPIAITFTVNDKAVGLAYPLASLIAGQNAAALGDANDPFGGLGRNGAQHTPEATTLKLPALGAANTFVAGKLHNLNSDSVITGHSDICKPEVVRVLMSAIEKT